MPKTWLITGASSGFGAELTKAVLAAGHRVAATFRNPEQADAFSHSHPRDAFGIVADVTNADQCAAAVQHTIERFQTIDVLVNNAGYGTIGAIEEWPEADVRHQMETNFFGALRLTQLVLPHMRAQGSGYILQISSQAGFRANPGFGIYNASKFALEGFSEALAGEVAPLGIRVVIVQPGPFRTEFAAGSIKKAPHRIDAYAKTPVGGMYTYIDKMDGTQEGDPVKAAQAMIQYVEDGKTTLRLPLGKSPFAAIRGKLAQVEADLKANEAIALSTLYNES